MATRFRRKPVEVEALRLTPDTVQYVTLWCGGFATEEIDPFDSDIRHPAINVPNYKGVMRASDGDYVVKSPWGEFFVMKKQAFDAEYEPI